MSFFKALGYVRGVISSNVTLNKQLKWFIEKPVQVDVGSKYIMKVILGERVRESSLSKYSLVLSFVNCMFLLCR